MPALPAELKPYPAYKPSGVEWLGDVPAHWEVRRLKTVAGILNGATPSTTTPAYWDGDIVWLTPEDLGRLTTPYVDRSARGITQAGYAACSTTLAPAGSLVISTRAPIGHLGILRTAACVNQGCRVIVPGAALRSGYLYYALHTARPELAARGQGTTFMELSRRELAAFVLALPPLAEQAAIARYLDQMDGRIRRYTQAKQKLIGLLEEYRQAVIHHAVTRGLDPAVRLKPSGVEWLGDVPAHWEVRRLKHWVGINEALLPETTKPEFAFRYVDIGAVGTGVLREAPAQTRFAAAPSRARRIVKSGDTLVSTVRPYLKASWFAAEVQAPLICSTGFAVLTPRPETAPKFVSYLTQSKGFVDRLTAESVGVAYPAIAESRLRSFHVSVPPLAEQAAIAGYLDKATGAIDKALAATRRQVALLGEYRARLIADVVTGQCDVRGAAVEG